jgi:hypothetical protein
MKQMIFLKTVFILTLSFVFVTFFNTLTFADEIVKNLAEDFVHEHDDCYNDNAPDHDNDGIPNGRDPDFNRGKAKGRRWRNNFVDKNGDGYNDNAPDHDNDGIPDIIDKDYKKIMCGSGYRHRTQEMSEEHESEEISDPGLKK